MEKILSNIETALSLISIIQIYLNRRVDIIDKKNQSKLMNFDRGLAESYSRQIDKLIRDNIISSFRPKLIAKELHRSMPQMHLHSEGDLELNPWETLISKNLDSEKNNLITTLRSTAYVFEKIKNRQRVTENDQVIVENGVIQEFGWQWLKRVNNDSYVHSNNIKVTLEQIKEKLIKLEAT